MPALTQYRLLLLLAMVLLTLGASGSEPTYKGRSLTSWLQQCYDASLEETQKISQAQAAINAIGAKKTLPILMSMVKARDGEVAPRISEKGSSPSIRFPDGLDIRQLGVAGFEALDTNGAPAVPDLTPMLADTNGGPASAAFVALRCLVAIGMPAEASVCSALTNRSPEIRAFAASQIGVVSDDITLYLERLEGPLADADGTVRFAAVQGLGLQTEYPEDVLPYLIRAMNDPLNSVAGYAIKFIGDLGTNGIKGAAALQHVVDTGDGYRAGIALRSLVSIAPEQALTTIMAWVASTNAEHRSRAAGLLAAFRPQTPETLEALKKATADPDPKVARSATGALERLRRTAKEDGSYQVAAAEEPTYKGRTLGEWLKRKPGQENFTSEARHAIQAMGTNALPSLLFRLTYTDSKYGLYDYDTGLEAVGGFLMLGEVALPLLPKLAELMTGNHQRIALFALLSCCNMGSNAIPVLAGGLTNKFADVRGEALHYLTDDPLAAFPEAKKAAKHALIPMLSDADHANRETATNILWEIDRAAGEELGLKRPRGRFK